MKRTAISIAFGLIFPVVYTIAAGTLTDVYPALFPDWQMFGQAVFHPIVAPTLFGIYFVIWLQHNSFLGLPLATDNPLFRVIVVVFPPIFLYSFACYAVLRFFGYSKAKKISEGPPPPPPIHGLSPDE